MAVIQVNSHKELINQIKDKENSYLLIYKSGTENSECALQNLKQIALQTDEMELYVVDVNEVQDIHPNYSISSVPSLLEFKMGTFINVIKGCHDEQYYKSLFENIVYIAKVKKEGKEPKRVVVYSTPTCSWCNTLKAYLRKNNIRFNDIDVSRDQTAAERMVSKSGRQGVPQTEINGQIIVGFDKQKINQLLEIQA